MHLWENTYNGDWKTAFKDRGAVPGNYGCKEGWGVGENDLGIRLADLTGSGRADYLCIERDGRVTGYLNRGNGVLEDVGTSASSFKLAKRQCTDVRKRSNKVANRL